MTGFEAGCEKSNPKIYIETLKQLGVKPEDAVMIEDDVISYNGHNSPKMIRHSHNLFRQSGKSRKTRASRGKVKQLSRSYRCD